MNETNYELINKNGYSVITYNDNGVSTEIYRFLDEKKARETLSCLQHQENKTNEELIDFIDEIKLNIEAIYNKEDVSLGMFSIYDNEVYDNYEIIFDDEVLDMYEDEDEANKMMLRYEYLYKVAFHEGLMVGINHPDYAIEILNKNKEELFFEDMD